MKRLRIIVSGKVQGVFFRDYTITTAKHLKLNGWVRNRNDGKVEILAEGDDEKLKEFVNWVKKGPTASKVSDVFVAEEKAKGSFKSFDIRETI